MTNTEINKKLAEFMEYEIIPYEDETNDLIVFKDKTKEFHCDWNPLNNISDAIEVVEKLKERNILLWINTWTDSIEVMRVGSMKPNSLNFYIFDEHPLSRAISLAALTVLEAENEK